MVPYRLGSEGWASVRLGCVFFMAHSGSKPDSREPMNVQSSDPIRFIDTLRIGPVSPGKFPKDRYCNMSAAGDAGHVCNVVAVAGRCFANMLPVPDAV
jgi:hypothetical protein